MKGMTPMSNNALGDRISSLAGLLTGPRAGHKLTTKHKLCQGLARLTGHSKAKIAKIWNLGFLGDPGGFV
jgi:hypothetical protein